MGGGCSRVKTVRAGLELAMPRRSVGPPPNGTNGRPYCPANARAVVIGIVHWVQLCLLINSRNAAHKLYCTVPDRGVEALIGMGQSCCAMDAGLELSTPLVSRSLQGGIRTAPLQNGTARRSHPNIPGLLSCSIAVPAQSLHPQCSLSTVGTVERSTRWTCDVHLHHRHRRPPFHFSPAGWHTLAGPRAAG